jgi:hypothetical protein
MRRAHARSVELYLEYWPEHLMSAVAQTITWTFTDECGRTITHVQTITIEPAPIAAFVNPPADISIIAMMRRILW